MPTSKHAKLVHFEPHPFFACRSIRSMDAGRANLKASVVWMPAPPPPLKTAEHIAMLILWILSCHAFCERSEQTCKARAFRAASVLCMPNEVEPVFGVPSSLEVSRPCLRLYGSKAEALSQCSSLPIPAARAPTPGNKRGSLSICSLDAKASALWMP